MSIIDPPGEKMIKIYKSNYGIHGYHPASLGCPKGRQKLRFETLAKYVKSGDNILDFGCGFGDLALFLEEKGLDVTYTGCDVVPEFIDVARKNYANGSFYLLSLGEIPVGFYDVIIASGVFNFK